MKYVILFFVGLLPFMLQAQLSGEIIYEEKINVHKRIPEERADMKEFIPEFRTENMVLLFNEEEAVYKKYVDENAETEEDVDMSPRRGRRMMFRNMRSNHILYQNYQSEERVEQRDFMDKKFLITGEPLQYAWKITGETKDVGDYIAHEATYADTNRTISAWFVPELAVPLGPGRYGQLPGLILHVDINEGERMLTAQKIDLREVEVDEIAKPTKGKEVTEEEFQEMVDERMKEMGGGPGGMRIITRRRPN